MSLRRRLAFAAPVLALAAVSSAEAADRHPSINAAIRSLRNAVNDLQHANHDFGGHRVEAMAACNQAISQLEQALRFDR